MGPERGLALERFAQPPVKPLDHPIRLWMIGADQSMDDAVRPAQVVETMRPGGLPRGLPFFVDGKPIGQRAIVIGQDGVHFLRKRGQEFFDGLRHRGGGAPGQHLDPDIAGGAVNGHEHITGLLLSFA